MKSQRGFTLPELVVGMSITATIGLIITSLIFSGYSMMNKNSADMYMGSYLKKEYSEFRKEVKQATVLCMKGGEAFTDPNSTMCGNPMSDPELATDQTLYLVNALNEEIYYKFETDGLFRYNKTDGTNELFMKQVTGSFTYTTANLLTVDLSFINNEQQPRLKFSTYYISINQ